MGGVHSNVILSFRPRVDNFKQVTVLADRLGVPQLTAQEEADCSIVLHASRESDGQGLIPADYSLIELMNAFLDRVDRASAESGVPMCDGLPLEF